MGKKACVFVRVSSTTDRQDYHRQIDDLYRFCASRGLEVVWEIKEKVSGALPNDEREAIQELLECARAGKFDCVAVTELSRLGRRAFEVRKLVEGLSAMGVAVMIETLGVSTLNHKGARDPMSNLLLAILGEFAEMERQTLIDRVKSGLDRARRRGVKLGRPKGSKLTKTELLIKYKPVVRDINAGLTVRKVAAVHRISTNTVQKVRDAMGVKK